VPFAFIHRIDIPVLLLGFSLFRKFAIGFLYLALLRAEFLSVMGLIKLL
jgi:hypothetical protein